MLKIWKSRKLTLEGKIIIFKTIMISKIVFQSLITTAPNRNVNNFFSGINHGQDKTWTLCKDYKVGGLKNSDMPNKTSSMLLDKTTL